MPGVIVDGADVIGCYLAARDAVARALAGEGPTLIEAKVTRLTGHSSDDQQTKYRSAEELAGQRARDPLPRFRDELRAAGLLVEASEAALAAEVAAAVDDATALRRSGAGPRPAALRSVPATSSVAGRRTELPDAGPDLHRGDPRGPPRRDAPRRAGHRPGRGRRPQGRRLLRDGRAVGGVRRRPRDRHAADRVDDRRRLDRRCGERPAPGRRDPVRRLHLPGDEPDHPGGGPDPLPEQRHLRLPDHDPGAVWRGRPRRALPQPVGGGLLRPRARPQGGDPIDPVRRQGPPSHGHPRPRPGHLPGAQEDVPQRSRRGARRRVHGALRPRRDPADRQPPHGRSPTA